MLFLFIMTFFSNFEWWTIASPSGMVGYDSLLDFNGCWSFFALKLKYTMHRRKLTVFFKVYSPLATPNYWFKWKQFSFEQIATIASCILHWRITPVRRTMFVLNYHFSKFLAAFCVFVRFKRRWMMFRANVLWPAKCKLVCVFFFVGWLVRDVSCLMACMLYSTCKPSIL